jgi:hypothetical protein
MRKQVIILSEIVEKISKSYPKARFPKQTKPGCIKNRIRIKIRLFVLDSIIVEVKIVKYFPLFKLVINLKLDKTSITLPTISNVSFKFPWLKT